MLLPGGAATDDVQPALRSADRHVDKVRCRGGTGREAVAIAQLQPSLCSHPTMCSCISVGMLVCMRTTMNLPDSLMQKVRARADSTHRTVTSLVEQALRELLARDQGPRESEEVLPTYGSPTTRPLVDIDDRDQLYSALDAERLG